MKYTRLLLAMAIVIACSVLVYPETPAEMGYRLSKQNDNRPVFEKVKSKATLTIFNSSGEVKFKKNLILGTYVENMSSANYCEKYITYCTAPADDQGNSYLMFHYKNREDVKWVYLKGIRKAKKVTGADKKLSFFGSDFTNAEAGKPNFLDWRYKYLGDEKVEFKGKMFDCYKVESLPRDNTVKNDLGCGKRIGFLEKKSLLTLRLDYYDENLVKIKEMHLLSFVTKKNIKGEKVNYETGLEMRSVKTGSKSILSFSDMRFEDEANLRTDIFSEQYLTQKWW